MSVKIGALNPSLNKKDFRCGKEMLDNYLHTQASQDIRRKLCVVFAMFEDTGMKGYTRFEIPQSPAEFFARTR